MLKNFAKFLDKDSAKIAIIAYFIIAVFCIIEFRMCYMLFSKKYHSRNVEHTYRHSIFDRNGNTLAVSIPVYNLYIDPSLTLDRHILAQKISHIFKDLQVFEIEERISRSGSGWILVKNGITEQERTNVINAGIESAFFDKDIKRLYPYDSLFSHIIGYTSHINSVESGAKGAESFFDDKLYKSDIILSLDARIQSVVHKLLNDRVKQYNALAGFAVIMDVKNGDVISLVSLPDFNPNIQINPFAGSATNNVTSSVYHVGSVFKIFTAAMALESGVKKDDVFELPRSIMVTNTFSITDEHRSRDKMTISEILAYSSNVGTSLMVQKIGFNAQRQFLEKFGAFMTPDEIEVPSGEIASPLYNHAKTWPTSVHYNIGYGYGISVSPLQFITMASGVIMGQVFNPTLLKNGNDGKIPRRIISDNSAIQMRQIMRDVVEIGTAKRATVNGYSVCGKTGTSRKFSHGAWSNTKKLLSFVSFFPCNDPQYIMYIGIDEPVQNGTLLQGGNAVAPIASDIIGVIAPMMNMIPDKIVKNGET